MPRTYATPLAFKTAVEQRLRNEAAASGMNLQRRRQLFVFDRFLARLFHVLEDAVVLKGGLVIELRLDRARTTKDIDLRMVGHPDDVLNRLQEAGRLDLGDYLQFEVTADPRHPEIDAEGMAYQGLRYRAEAQLAAKIYGAPFGIDVAFAEPMHGQAEEVAGSTFLEFAGVAPGRYRIYPLETHIAEKLHAYTLPRERPNSRVKDLPDLALLATAREIDGAALRPEAIPHGDLLLRPPVVPALQGWADPEGARSQGHELGGRGLGGRGVGRTSRPRRVAQAEVDHADLLKRWRTRQDQGARHPWAVSARPEYRAPVGRRHHHDLVPGEIPVSPPLGDRRTL